MKTDIRLCNSREICTRLGISRRGFERRVKTLRQFGLFQEKPGGCYFMRYENLVKYIEGLESGLLQPIIEALESTPE